MTYIAQTLQTANQLRECNPVELVTLASDHTSEVFQRKVGSVPVVICARNEETDLPATLVSLSLQADADVAPIVVDNASHDDTVEVALRMGATVLHEQTPGKNGAFVRGAAYARDMFGKDQPLLFTDADTVVGARWVSTLERRVKLMNQGFGALIVGNVIIRHGNSLLTDWIRSAALYARQIERQILNLPPGARGSNTGVVLSDEGIGELYKLPHNIFPYQDRGVRDALLAAGSDAGTIFHPYGTVVSKGDRFSSLKEYLQFIKGKVPVTQVYPNSELPVKL